MRMLYSSISPSIEYSLTPLGVTITDITGQICRWAAGQFKLVLVAYLENRYFLKSFTFNALD
jgi:DNA-binding HxlR family transcriptional regulator